MRVTPTVHPRVCGERLGSPAIGCAARGSSPRVRGTHPRPMPKLSPYRFIPACAGNAGSGDRGSGVPSVHPRVCGERGQHGTAEGVVGGSSPRVRGTRNGRQRRRRGSRFIPACAGNAFLRSSYPPISAVHPRVCGERSRNRGDAIPRSGSSPRVRGTRLCRVRRRRGGRFIPACAGNAVGEEARTTMWAVHPRVCGERRYLTEGIPPGSGSSPRVRGTRLLSRRPGL